MSSIFSPGLQIATDVIAVRARELPIVGEVLVQPGDAVRADQVVARATLAGDIQIARVAESLGIEPADVIRGCGVATGDAVRVGQTLVEHSGLFGLFRSKFTAPIDGVVELISEETGHIALRTEARLLELKAYVSGSVRSVNPGRSVTIETRGAFVQGIFGVGGERFGNLRKIEVAPGSVLTPEMIPADCQGAVLFGGTAPSPEAVRLASERGAVGLIVGAIDDRALKEYLGYDLGIAITGDEKVSMTVIVTEGFGHMAISTRVLEVLGALNGQPCSINGATQVRAGAMRPEILVPHAQHGALGDVRPADCTLVVGCRVRLTRVPYFGAQGIVTELPHKPVELPTGAMARVLKAKLDNGNEVVVPRANVELS